MNSGLPRRAFLTLTSGTLAVATGCLQATDDSSNTGESSPREPNTRLSASPSPTKQETSQNPSMTHSCETQSISADLVINNNLLSAHTVTVNLVRNQNGEESIFFERTYEVPASGYIQESEKIFADYKGGKCTATATTATGWSETSDVTDVTKSPWNYGIMVELNDNDDHISIRKYHSDPGTAHNPNCY